MLKESYYDTECTVEHQQNKLDISTSLSAIPASHRYLQRRPDVRSFERPKRLTEKSFAPSDLCYISPARQWKDKKLDPKVRQTMILQTCFETGAKKSSNTSMPASLMTTKVPTSTQRFIKKTVYECAYSRKLDYQDDQLKQNGINQLFETDQDYKLQASNLRKQTLKLEQTVTRLTLQTQRQELQIRTLQQTLQKQNQQMQILDKFIDNLKKSLEREEKSRKMKQELNHYLQDVIIGLNSEIDKLLANSTKTQAAQSLLIQTIDEGQDKISELQEYISSKRNMLNYCEAQISVLKIKNYQLEKNEEEIDTYININKKLKKKLNGLDSFRRSIISQERDQRRYQDRELTLQLSPEK